MKKLAIINRKKSKIKQIAKKFETKLSRNEWILYMHLIDESDNQTLSVQKSLKQLHTELKLAINTIKSCRLKLKDYGFIDYQRDKYEITCYKIRDLLKNPIAELPELASKQCIPSPTPNKQNSYSDYNYDFVEDDLKASFMLYVKYRIEHGDNFTQSEVKKQYDTLIYVVGFDQLKDYISSQIVQDEYYKVIDRYSLDFIEEDIKEDMEDIIWEHDRIQAPLSQREVENIHMTVYIDCNGKIENMKKALHKLKGTAR
jgi:hypothetical protein